MIDNRSERSLRSDHLNETSSSVIPNNDHLPFMRSPAILLSYEFL